MGPIYGENSAPIRWEKTIAPFLEDIGFIRGDNGRGIFYHPERDLLVLLYVDDCLIDAFEGDIVWFVEQMNDRFECKEVEWLTVNNPLDRLGMLILMDNQNVYLLMEPYIERMLSDLGTTCSPNLVLSRDDWIFLHSC